MVKCNHRDKHGKSLKVYYDFVDGKFYWYCAYCDEMGVDAKKGN